MSRNPMRKCLTFAKYCFLRQNRACRITRTLTTFSPNDGKYFEFSLLIVIQLLQNYKIDSKLVWYDPLSFVTRLEWSKTLHVDQSSEK